LPPVASILIVAALTLPSPVSVNNLGNASSDKSVLDQLLDLS